MNTTPAPQTSGLQKLFPAGDCYTPGDPVRYGFRELEQPDAFRRIKPDASCCLPSPDMNERSRMVLMVTAKVDSKAPAGQLAVELNGCPLGKKNVPAYGHFYFPVAKEMIDPRHPVSIRLKVSGDGASVDSAAVDMAIYHLQLIDVEGEGKDFGERAVFLDQLRIFRRNISNLPSILNRMKLNGDSIILDVGAGVGWTTVLLAARTGARAVAIDPFYYQQGQALKYELREMFSRHLCVLTREPGFESIRNQDDLDETIDRCGFLTMSAMDMEFEDNTFDFVFSLNAMEHIPDPALALREITRILKPGGEAFLQFTPIYNSDTGSHLPGTGLLNKPWAQLLYDRDEIRRMVIETGKVPNEIDNILDSLNGWSFKQYQEMLQNSELKILKKVVFSGFSIDGAEQSEAFKGLLEKYPREELTTLGLQLHLRKKSVGKWRIFSWFR